MNAERRTRLIVFDLDGTLVDSRRDLADAANALLASYAAPPLAEEAVGRMVGDGAAVLVARVLDARGLVPHPPGALERFLELYNGRLTEHTVPYPGIPESLEQVAASATLAVLTNKPTPQTVVILESLGLARRFAWVYGGTSGFPRKPDPGALVDLMARAGSSPGATVLVGDSHVDVRTARNAGVRACVARYGFGFPAMPPGELSGEELVVDHPAQLPAVLRHFLNGSSQDR